MEGGWGWHGRWRRKPKISRRLHNLESDNRCVVVFKCGNDGCGSDGVRGGGGGDEEGVGVRGVLRRRPKTSSRLRHNSITWNLTTSGVWWS